ncbi:MAG: cyclic nucleotide-binding domain-containing protein [Desulfobacterales bacterium]|jgi:CRP-like cAMP-binding protein|nr:cyclic nucleotide-binding domain-containing protein [Desulfobacterales bacterium]
MMVAKEDLKQIAMLRYLTDEMLDKLIPITKLLYFDKRELIFRQGEKSRHFYMLKEGKVILEQRITDKIAVSVSAIKPGNSFGWSAMLDGEEYSIDAVCAEPCKVFMLRDKEIKALFEEDHSLGFIMSQRLLRIIKKQYDIRTEQFLKTLRHHPEISNLL